jgi:hypothetical protein
MGAKHGLTDISKIYKGNTEISKAYAEGEVIFTSGGSPGGPAVVDAGKYDYTGETTTVQATISLSPDGLTAHIIGGISGAVTMFQYTLGTAFDLATMSYTGTSLLLFASGQNVRHHTWKPDGTKFYLTQFQGTIYEYTCTTPWDIATASLSGTLSIAAQTTSPFGGTFSPDGTRFFVLSNAGDAVWSFNLTTAWDITTASVVANKMLAEDTTPRQILFSTDGMRALFVGNTTDTVYQYTLGTAWDVTTMTLIAGTIDCQATIAENTVMSMWISPDGLRLFVTGNQTDKAHSYTLSNPFSLI